MTARGRHHGRTCARLLSWSALVSTICAADTASAQAVPQGIRWPTIASDSRRLPTIVLSEPALRLGTGAGADTALLAGIIGTVRLPTGSIVVADAGNARLIQFGPTGRVQRAAGRSGDGPGEFRLPRWFGRCSDGSLAVFDAANLRMTYLDPSLGVSRSSTVPTGLNFDRVLWCAGSGRVLILRNHGGLVVKPGFSSVRTVLLQVQGSVVDTLEAFGEQEYYFPRRGAAFTAVPLGRSTLASANRSHLYLCSNQAGECRLFDSTGTIRRSFVIDLPHLPLSEQQWAQARRAYVDAEPLPRVRRRLDSVLTEVPRLAQFPRIDQVNIDAQGALWIRTFDNYSSQVATLVIIDSDGRPVARAVVPRKLQILEIGKNHLLGLSREPDGSEHVELYRFTELPAGIPPSRD